MPNKIVLHWYRNLLEPFVESLHRAGIETVEGNPKNGLESFDWPGLHLIWGCPETARDAPNNLWEKLRDRNDVWFCEQGWFPQRGHFYLDRRGPNGYSELRGTALRHELRAPEEAWLDDRLAELHGPIKAEAGDFIFCPLQVEVDSNIRLWSHIPECPHRVRQFAEWVCLAFPNEQIVFRSHPMERAHDGRFVKLVSNYPNATLCNDNTSLEWCARAKAVVGINSTVLIEALTFGKPVLAFGEGVFSDNDVCLEVRGDKSRLPEILDYRHDQWSIRRFLHLLWERQIPVAAPPEEFDRYPMLAHFVHHARGPAVIRIPDPPPAPPRSAEVWGFLEYPDLPKPGVPEKTLECTKQNGVQGVILNDLCLEDWHSDIAAWLFARTRQCIPMFTEDLAYPHYRRLDRAKRFGGKIALGNSQTHEWSGGFREAQRYLEFADKNGFEWVCTLTHHSLLRDLSAGQQLRKVLVEHDVLTFCLCGNVLLGYLFDEPKMPGLNGTSLTGHDLNREFGLTIDRLREYCQGLRIFSGAGGAPGLKLGSRLYAAECGFRGILCWTPFDLAGSMEVTIRPRPAEYPRSVGGEDVGIGDDFRREKE